MVSLLTTTRSDNVLDANVEGDDNPDGQKNIVDFLTLQSLSFPIASGAVAGAWKVLQAIFGAWADQKSVPLALAALIILATVASSWVDLGSASKRFGAIAIGAVNALLLTAGALGVVLGLPATV